MTYNIPVGFLAISKIFRCILHFLVTTVLYASHKTDGLNDLSFVS